MERFFHTGSKAGIQAKHADKLHLQLFALDNAKQPADMNAPGWKLHRLAGTLKGRWAIRVSGNWRLTFPFEGEDAILG
jgi:toxin HigB-1